MPTSILMIKRPNAGLIPVTQYDWDLFDEIPANRDLGVKVTLPNSTRLNRFYWALLGKVIINHPFYKRPEQLHLFIKTRLGYVTEIHFHDGEVVMKVDSTSFEKMDGIARRAFVRGAVDLIIEEIIPGMGRSQLLEEIEKMLGMTFDSVAGELPPPRSRVA